MSIIAVIAALNPGIFHHMKKILFKLIVHSLTISIMGGTKVRNLIKMSAFFSVKMTWQNFIMDHVEEVISIDASLFGNHIIHFTFLLINHLQSCLHKLQAIQHQQQLQSSNKKKL
jgi:hypothetical protein